MVELEGMNDGMIKLTLFKLLPKGHPDIGEMPIYFFNIRRVSDNIIVGQCDLRVGDDARMFYLGHVGYSILPNYQGHRYAWRACQLMMQLAQKAGMTELYITCNPDNIPSIRTCEALGAKFLGIWDVPPDNIEYANGNYQKCRYYLPL